MSNPRLLHGVVFSKLWSLMGTGASSVIGLVLAASVVRLLGVESAGYATAVISVIGIATSVGGFGLSASLVRDISAIDPADRGAIQQAAGGALLVLVLSGLAGGGLFAVAAPWIDQWAGALPSGGVTFCMLSGAAFVFSQWTSGLLSIVEARLRYDRRTIAIVSSLAAQCAATIVVLRHVPGIEALGWINLSAALLRAVLAYLACRKALGWVPRPVWRGPALVRQWRYARWVYARQLSNLLLGSFDRVLLVSNFGSAQLPYYTMARRFFEAGHETLTAPAGMFVPMIGGAGSKGGQLALDLDDRVRWFFALFAAWLYSGVLLLGPLLLTWMVGSDFALGARFATAIFALVGFVHAQSIYPFYVLMATDRPKGTFFFQLACGLGSLVAMAAGGAWGGFQMAALGQLWVVVPVSLLLVSARPESGAAARIGAVVKPLVVPAIGFGVAAAVHVCWWVAWCGPLSLAVAGVIWSLVFVPLACRIERRLDSQSARLDTLHRAVLIATRKIGLDPIWAARICGVERGLAATGGTSG